MIAGVTDIVTAMNERNGGPPETRLKAALEPPPPEEPVATGTDEDVPFLPMPPHQPP